MYLSQKHISRRTVLKGVGATIALPLIDAMNPAATAWAQTAAGAPPKRFAFVGFPHGAIMDRWAPPQTGAGFEMSPILQPLEPLRQHLTVVSGLRNKPGETPEPHGYIEMTWLTCVKPWEHGANGPDFGVSADQLAARHIGQDTRLPSLELTTALGGARVAWRTATQSLPQEGNPRAVFQKLFGQGDTDKERAAILSETGSILDRVKGQAARLQASLGVQDRVVVSDYLDSVREIERRVQMASHQDMSRLDIPDAPVGTPNDLTEHFKLMFDLMALAFQADITRVFTFMMARDLHNRTYPQIGVDEPHHGLSHHQNKADKIARFARINAYHVSLFGKFLDKLKATPDGDGSVLDHSVILYGSGMGNANVHSHIALPYLVAGTGAGTIQGGRHIKARTHDPSGNLLLSVTDKFGIARDRVGLSTGRVDL
jgi:hypothetical protein